MTRLLPLAVAALLAGTALAEANPIERACLASGQGTRAVCTCIGQVADAILDRRQIREGARWFEDPQRAQDVRESDRPRDREMWSLWRTFSTAAEQRCAG